MAFQDDIREAADDLFDLAGEVVTYVPNSTAPYTVTALFRRLTVDDLVSEHVMADAIICQIREAELQEPPVRGDIIEREQPFGMQTLMVVDRSRDKSGIWRLTCQQNIRVMP